MICALCVGSSCSSRWWNLTKELQTAPHYSLMIDESTDNSTTQKLIRFFTWDGAVASMLNELLEAQNKSCIFGLNLKLPVLTVDAIHSTYSQPCDCLLQVFIQFTMRTNPVGRTGQGWWNLRLWETSRLQFTSKNYWSCCVQSMGYQDSAIRYHSGQYSVSHSLPISCLSTVKGVLASIILSRLRPGEGLNRPHISINNNITRHTQSLLVLGTTWLQKSIWNLV